VFTLFLRTANRLAVVVGGGAVGRRKASACLDGGFQVRVVDPAAAPLPGVEWVAKAYHADHLNGATVVVAAATPTVNAIVVADARRAGVPVCDAANPDAGDFDFPATVRHGDFTIAISTGGASPALSRRIRNRIESEFGPEYGEWVAVLRAVRRRVLEVVPDAADRRRLLTAFADDRWLDRLREVGADKVLKEMLAGVEAADGPV